MSDTLAWSFLGFELAKRGIGSDVEEIITDAYECDPWRPQPDTQAMTVILDLAGASKLVGILEEDAARRVTDLNELVLETLKAAGHHIGWFDPGSKRFCYEDEKKSWPDKRSTYTLPIFAIAALGITTEDDE